MKNLGLKKGFTLIELLLYITISATLLLVVSFFTITLFQSRIKNQTIMEVEQQGTLVMQNIKQIIRNADTINSPAPGTSANTLSINTYLAGNNPTVYDLSGGVLRIKQGSGGAVELTNSRVTVSNLVFSNLSQALTPGIIRIQFIITHNNPSARNEYYYQKTFTSSAALRQP